MSEQKVFPQKSFPVWDEIIFLRATFVEISETCSNKQMISREKKMKVGAAFAADGTAVTAEAFLQEIYECQYATKKSV